MTHGGAASLSDHKDGPERAARHGLEVLRKGGSPLDAAVQAVVDLEDDERFNAGTGSNLRFDGKTIEMDASVMDSSGRFGAVACLRRVKNPILVARAVMRTPHNLLAGEGANRFARSLGMADHDPWTPRAQEKFDLLMKALRQQHMRASEFGWDLGELRSLWNYEVALNEIIGAQDTVGAVVSDGERYAAALSTGGTISTLLGRVGDVPLPGCGLHAGPHGAVATTGDGDALTRLNLAARAYRWLEEGMSPEAVRDAAIALVAPETDVGIIVVKGDKYAGGSNRDMAWGHAQGEA
ncbi:MAG TPA: isoaspartyl peptidase/L-asparaginase [Candidatus Thermoplasmatota archaeon]|nr:isoaspartyl peptidase/L-asparaginase [Candidatus Thermoplasmatota archaeon]